jgi:hypothetical protein
MARKESLEGGFIAALGETLEQLSIGRSHDTSIRKQLLLFDRSQPMPDQVFIECRVTWGSFSPAI